MKRQSLNDGSEWFDIDKARQYREDTTFDGSNNISCATGSQWDHQALYLTASGRWVLNCWSQWAGTLDSWEEIDSESAVTWMIRNGHEDEEIVEEAMAAREM